MRTALLLTGRDTLPLLHRISSNALTGLPEGAWRPTLFCDFRGRLLHRALVVHAPGGAVWLLRDDAPGAELAAFIDKHVFREDLRIEDRSDAPLPSLDVTPPLPATLDELARIEAGAPRHGHEIAEAFTAYEVGLAAEVHLAKGCYTGQEALQRLVTYDSARRQLVRVAGAGAPPEVPAQVMSGDAAAGLVTSAIAAGENWQGLASLRRDRVAEGAAFALADGREVRVAHVFALAKPQCRG